MANIGVHTATLQKLTPDYPSIASDVSKAKVPFFTINGKIALVDGDVTLPHHSPSVPYTISGSGHLTVDGNRVSLLLIDKATCNKVLKTSEFMTSDIG